MQFVFVFGVCVVLEFGPLFDVLRQQLAFCNVVFVCLQNDVGECCVCCVWVSGCVSSISLFCESFYGSH